MKYLDKIYDGRWKVVRRIVVKDTKQVKYELKNIYNDRTLMIDERTLRKVEKGETTVSRVVSHNIQFKRFAM